MHSNATPPARPGDRVGRRDPRGHRGPAARLPARALRAWPSAGVSTVASDELARAAGVNSAKLRKDLCHLGSYGIRGVGYDVEYLVYQVSRALGLTQDWPVVIVGAGNLGRALANYGGFVSRGFRIAAVLRRRSRLIVGSTIARRRPSGTSTSSRRVVTGHNVSIGVIAVPPAPRRRCATGWSPPA